MVNEILDALVTNKGIYVDATLGFGGHSKAILDKYKDIELIGIDQDIEALNAVTLENDNFSKIKANFSSIDVALYLKNIEKVEGILADIGISSFQIDESRRGFSYSQEAPLDMRMDSNKELSAKNIVNEYSEKDLADIIYRYGEERNSRRIAKNIVLARENNIIKTTKELFDIVTKSSNNLSSVKRVFQAIRIEVNNELQNLEIFLNKAESLLNKGGRIAILTFHSLEDRIVKNFFKDSNSLKQIHKKAIVPSEEELKNNSRAKSAKLRVAEKII